MFKTFVSCEETNIKDLKRGKVEKVRGYETA